MAGQIDKENLAITMARGLLVTPLTKNEGNIKSATVLLFTRQCDIVLQSLANEYPEIAPISKDYYAKFAANEYDSLFVDVFNALTDGKWPATHPVCMDCRYIILIVALLTLLYSNTEEGDEQIKGFLNLLEDGYAESLAELGLQEQMLLATALYLYNYEGDFCDLMAQHYYSLKSEGFGESLDEIKAQRVQRERDLSGYAILDSELTPTNNQTNGSPWFQWIGEDDMSWFILDNTTLWDAIYMSNNALPPLLAGEEAVFSHMRSITKSIVKRAYHVAAECNKPFDVSVSGKMVRKRTVNVDIPYEVKVGLFKKETRYRSEQKTESHIEHADIRFNGWLLEHFERIKYEEIHNEFFNESHEWLFTWDYCLGSDGELYVISSSRNHNEELEYKVYKMTGMFESFFELATNNTFISVSHGWMGALDTTPMVPSDQRKHSIQVGKDTFIFDFPIQLNDRSEYPFPKEGDGLRTRLDALLK